ncbi:MAG: hypothetical protein ABW034_08725, partial [Steroidobacteraceae bacterium]
MIDSTRRAELEKLIDKDAMRELVYRYSLYMDSGALPMEWYFHPRIVRRGVVMFSLTGKVAVVAGGSRGIG